MSGQDVGLSVKMLSELQVTEEKNYHLKQAVLASGLVASAAPWCHLGLRWFLSPQPSLNWCHSAGHARPCACLTGEGQALPQAGVLMGSGPLWRRTCPGPISHHGNPLS